MKKWSSLAAAIACAVAASALTPATGSAQVLFKNVPDRVGGYGSPEAEPFANDFTLLSAASVTSFTWWGTEETIVPAFTASFTWAISADLSGAPDPVAIATGTATGVVGNNTATYSCCTYNGYAFATYEFTQFITGVPLLAGPRYWLTISNFSGGDGTTFFASAPLVGDDELLNGGGGWTSPVRAGFHTDGALCVSGPVESCSEFTDVRTPVEATPEPASLVLLATGFGVVGGIARRRKAR